MLSLVQPYEALLCEAQDRSSKLFQDEPGGGHQQPGQGFVLYLHEVSPGQMMPEDSLCYFSKLRAHWQ